MSDGAAFRGQPLLLLGLLVFGWLAIRAVQWQPSLEPLAPPQGLARATPPASPALAANVRRPAAAPVPLAAEPVAALTAPAGSSFAAPVEPVLLPEPVDAIAPIPAPIAAPAPPPPPRLSIRAAIGHNLLLVAGLAQMELPPALLAYFEAALPPAPGVPAAAPMLAAAPSRPASAGLRWSADSWLLLRDDKVTPFLSGRPSYGRSQAGAVVRYALAPANPRRPQLYVRASSALTGAHEQELAVGVSARPLARVPLRLSVEGRIGETDHGTRVRPAAYAVTEFPPLRLPHGIRGEVYAQGGYVGGAFSTAFADGQARLERPLVRHGEFELSAGAAAWGGAQRDAARIDIGPSATVSFRLGEAFGRVAADYRFRVAGNAEPSSGPALTVSAGF